MSFLITVQKYCTRIPRNERYQMTRKWLDLPNDIIRIFTQIKCSMDDIKDMYQYIFFKSIILLIGIRKELSELNFNSANNFISAAWAYFSLLLITLVNRPAMNYQEVDSTVNSIKSYILLYIIVDHTLDSDKSALSQFKECFSRIFKGEVPNKEVHRNKDVSFQNIAPKDEENTIKRILDKSCLLLRDILVNSPKSFPYIADIAKAEFSSVDVQNKEHDKLNMCYTKGATSTLAGCAIMNDGMIFPGTGLVGKIGQLFDDIVDIDEDLQAGILTYPIKCYTESGNIDAVVCVLRDLVEELPENYFAVKKWIYYMLCTFLINTAYISEDLRSSLLDYSLLLYKGPSEEGSTPKYFANFFKVFDSYTEKSL